MYLSLLEAIVWRQMLIIAVIALVVSTIVLKIASALRFVDDSKLASFVGAGAGFSVIFFLNVLENSTLVIAGVISAVVSLVVGRIVMSVLDSSAAKKVGMTIGNTIDNLADKRDGNEIYDIISNHDKKYRVHRLFSLQPPYSISIDAPLDLAYVLEPFKTQADYIEKSNVYEKIRLEVVEEVNNISISFEIPAAEVRLSAHNQSNGILEVDILVFPPTTSNPEHVYLPKEQYDDIKFEQACLIDDILTFTMDILNELCPSNKITLKLVALRNTGT